MSHIFYISIHSFFNVNNVNIAKIFTEKIIRDKVFKLIKLVIDKNTHIAVELTAHVNDSVSQIWEFIKKEFNEAWWREIISVVEVFGITNKWLWYFPVVLNYAFL